MDISEIKRMLDSGVDYHIVGRRHNVVICPGSTAPGFNGIMMIAYRIYELDDRGDEDCITIHIQKR